MGLKVAFVNAGLLAPGVREHFVEGVLPRLRTIPGVEFLNTGEPEGRPGDPEIPGLLKKYYADHNPEAIIGRIRPRIEEGIKLINSADLVIVFCDYAPDGLTGEKEAAFFVGNALHNGNEYWACIPQVGTDIWFSVPDSVVACADRRLRNYDELFEALKEWGLRERVPC